MSGWVSALYKPVRWYDKSTLTSFIFDGLQARVFWACEECICILLGKTFENSVVIIVTIVAVMLGIAVFLCFAHI
jgi:hypothetical protein